MECNGKLKPFEGFKNKKFWFAGKEPNQKKGDPRSRRERIRRIARLKAAKLKTEEDSQSINDLPYNSASDTSEAEEELDQGSRDIIANLLCEDEDDNEEETREKSNKE